MGNLAHFKEVFPKFWIYLDLSVSYNVLWKEKLLQINFVEV